MTKEKLQEIMKDNFIVECELDDVLNFVADLLYWRRRELEQNESYATNTIQRLQRAEEEVADLTYYVEEIMQEDAK